MTEQQNKLVKAAQTIVQEMNGMTFPEAIVVFGAVSDAITGGQSREASICKTKMEEAMLWLARASDVRAAQESIAAEAVAQAKAPAKKSRKTKKLPTK